MATKYIVKSKKGWEVKNAKAARATRIFETQALAIDYAAGIKGTKTIMVHDHEGKFREITGWDQVNASNDVIHPEKNYPAGKKKKYSKWLYVLPYVVFVAVGAVIGMWIGGLF